MTARKFLNPSRSPIRIPEFAEKKCFKLTSMYVLCRPNMYPEVTKELPNDFFNWKIVRKFKKIP